MFGDSGNQQAGYILYAHQWDLLKLEATSIMEMWAGGNAGLTMDSNSIVSLPYCPRVCVEKTSNDSLSTSLTNVFQGGSTTTHKIQGITYSNSTGRFTVPVAGTYMVMANLIMDSGGSPSIGDFHIQVNNEGSPYTWSAIGVAVYAIVAPDENTIIFMLDLSATHYIEILYQGTSNTFAALAGSTISMWKIA
jgi:hypothetical protein